MSADETDTDDPGEDHDAVQPCRVLQVLLRVVDDEPAQAPRTPAEISPTIAPTRRRSRRFSAPE